MIIGNPPYVEYSKAKKDYIANGYRTERCGNLYAFVIERSFEIARTNGFFGMIVQLPIVCTDRMAPLQKEFLDQSNIAWFSNFDDRPAKLFDGLEHIRATIFLSRKVKTTSLTIYSTKYNRWYTELRPYLFESFSFDIITDLIMNGVFPKTGNIIARKIRQKIASYLPLNRYLVNVSKYKVYFHNAPQYWVRGMTYAPYFWNKRDGIKLSTQIKVINTASKLDSAVVTASLNNSLFYWWFVTQSDCRHLNLREIETFPIGIDHMPNLIKNRLEELTSNLMVDYKKHAVRKQTIYKTTGKVIYDEFCPRYSKPIIDEIDKVLSKHYGFTDEELDFIINYDIKYRMGKEEV